MFKKNNAYKILVCKQKLSDSLVLFGREMQWQNQDFLRKGSILYNKDDLTKK